MVRPGDTVSIVDLNGWAALYRTDELLDADARGAMVAGARALVVASFRGARGPAYVLVGGGIAAGWVPSYALRVTT